MSWERKFPEEALTEAGGTQKSSWGVGKDRMSRILPEAGETSWAGDAA